MLNQLNGLAAGHLKQPRFDQIPILRGDVLDKWLLHDLRLIIAADQCCTGFINKQPLLPAGYDNHIRGVFDNSPVSFFCGKPLRNIAGDRKKLDDFPLLIADRSYFVLHIHDMAVFVQVRGGYEHLKRVLER
ncbi:hypothetical protein D3C85_1014200 [compost metagenome]